MSHDDMPSFGQPEAQKDLLQKQTANDLHQEPGLTLQDQKEAVSKVIKIFAILVAVLIGSVFLWKGANFAWNKYNLGKIESGLQKIIDDKLIDAERTKYTKQYDDWVAQVQPDYDQFYPSKSEYEFQKIVGAHKRLMSAATTRLDFIEGQIKQVLASPEKSEIQIREATSLWVDWKDQTVIKAERQAVNEDRLVKQYFAKIKPKEEPKKELPPVEAALTPPVAVEKPAVAPAPAKPIDKKPVAVAPQKKQPQESAADRDYLKEVQKMMIQK